MSYGIQYTQAETLTVLSLRDQGLTGQRLYNAFLDYGFDRSYQSVRSKIEVLREKRFIR